MAGSGVRSRERAFVPEPSMEPVWPHTSGCTLEVINHLNCWDHITKLRFLKESLRGDALGAFNGLSPEDQGNYGAVKETLLKTFGGAWRPPTATCPRRLSLPTAWVRATTSKGNWQSTREVPGGLRGPGLHGPPKLVGGGHRHDLDTPRPLKMW